MRTKYKGYLILVNREKCNAGYSLIYFSVYSKSGYECICDFEDSEEHVMTVAKDLKRMIDEEIKNKTFFGEFDTCEAPELNIAR